MPNGRGENGMENQKRVRVEGAQRSVTWQPWIRAVEELLPDEEYQLWLEQRVFDEEERE
jgi:hypothetical protein